MKAYLAQFALSCLYAAGLERVRPWYERHGLTEATVIVGVLLALWPAQVLNRWDRRHVLLGFVVSGAPITAWQAWLFIKRIGESNER
jgi:hypothetical protein